MIFIYILVYIYIYTPEFHFHLDSAPRFSGLEMYLEALDKASWSLFPQSLEQDLAKGETFTDANQDGPFHRPQAERLWQKGGTPKSLMNFEVFGVDIDWTSRIWHQVVLFLHLFLSTNKNCSRKTMPSLANPRAFRHIWPSLGKNSHAANPQSQIIMSAEWWIWRTNHHFTVILKRKNA